MTDASSFDQGTQELILQHFGPGHIEKIEKIHNLEAPDGSSFRFEYALAIWKYAKELTSKRAAVAETQARLERLARRASAVREAIPDQSIDVDDDIELAFIAAGVDVAVLREQLDRLMRIGQLGPSVKAGRPETMLIARIGDIYEGLTGGNAAVTASIMDWMETDQHYSGKFFTVCQMVDEAAARFCRRAPLSNGALGEVIKSVREKKMKLKKSDELQAQSDQRVSLLLHSPEFAEAQGLTREFTDEDLAKLRQAQRTFRRGLEEKRGGGGS